MTTSAGQGEGSPVAFYERYGSSEPGAPRRRSSRLELR